MSEIGGWTEHTPGWLSRGIQMDMERRAMSALSGACVRRASHVLETEPSLKILVNTCLCTSNGSLLTLTSMRVSCSPIWYRSTGPWPFTSATVPCCGIGSEKSSSTAPTKWPRTVEIRYGCFEEVDAGGRPGVCPELLHEAAMVERAALGTGGVRDMHGLSGIEDCIAVHGDRIDVVETSAETDRPSAVPQRHLVEEARRRCGRARRGSVRGGQCGGAERDVRAAVERACAKAEPAMPAPTMTTSYDEQWAIFWDI